MSSVGKQAPLISLSGSWVNEGVFEAGFSTVTFYGVSPSTISGNTSFYTFQSTAPGKTFYFTAGTTQTIINRLILAGTSENRIFLRSASNGEKWALDVSTNQVADYVDVKDSDALSHTITAFNSVDSGNNNPNWIFDGPPAAVNDLTASSLEDGNILLHWTAPGENGWNGEITDGRYKIRWSTIDLSTDGWQDDWDEGTAFWTDDYDNRYSLDFATTTEGPYEKHSKIIENLCGGVTYYFRIWTRDSDSRWSDISNAATTTVTKVLSIEIAPPAEYDFGSIGLGKSTTSLSSLDIVNAGNIPVDYRLKISSVSFDDNRQSLWKPTTTAAGHDLFIFYSVFHGTGASTVDFDVDDVVVGEYRVSSGTRFTVEGAGEPYKQTGAAVAKQDERNLWLKIDMPVTLSATGRKKITLRIEAKEHE